MLRFLSVILAALAAACAGVRTAPATQSSAPFDAAKSDPKAVEIADRVLTAVGGEAAWARAREIVWSQEITEDGQVVIHVKHAWDRWNGRHQFTRLDPNGTKGVAMYEIYDDVGSAMVNGKRVSTSDARRMIQEARQRWTFDTYQLFMPFKLKDPGVRLSYVEERAAEDGDLEVAKYDVIKVTFDPSVGPSQDTYYVVVDRETHLPHIVEWVRQGEPDERRIGYRWEKWVEVNGLKFATFRQNLGLPGETITFSDIQVSSDPDDTRYIPQVR